MGTPTKDNGRGPELSEFEHFIDVELPAFCRRHGLSESYVCQKALLNRRAAAQIRNKNQRTIDQVKRLRKWMLVREAVCDAPTEGEG